MCGGCRARDLLRRHLSFPKRAASWGLLVGLGFRVRRTVSKPFAQMSNLRVLVQIKGLETLCVTLPYLGMEPGQNALCSIIYEKTTVL